MKITGLNHITINVKNLEESKHFYKEVLGLKECGFIHMGDHTLTYFHLTDGCRLELIDYLMPAETVCVKETDRGTYRHFCLETEGLTDLYEDLCRKNVTITKTPSYVEKLGCSNILIIDPNGVEIEIIEK